MTPTLQEARRSWTRVFWINVAAGMLNFALSFTGSLPALRAINVVAMLVSLGFAAWTLRKLKAL